MFTHKIYILLVVVFCSACNTIYLPSSQSPNLFEKKKQGMLSVAGFSANTNVKFAYSPKNNFYSTTQNKFYKSNHKYNTNNSISNSDNCDK